MRLSVSLALVLASSLASAFTVPKRQTTEDPPQCAVACSEQYNPAPCGDTDVACICLNQQYSEQVGQCVVSTCSQQDQQNALTWAENECKAVGIDPQNPLPACATPCITNTPSSAGCNSEDETCLCKDNTYILAVDSCFKNSCTGQDLSTSEVVGEALCRSVGTDISGIVNGTTTA